MQYFYGYFYGDWQSATTLTPKVSEQQKNTAVQSRVQGGRKTSVRDIMSWRQR